MGIGKLTNLITEIFVSKIVSVIEQALMYQWEKWLVSLTILVDSYHYKLFNNEKC